MPKRIDANQPLLVRSWRDTGASVAHTHVIGGGFPDVVVGVRGLTLVGRFDIAAARRALSGVGYLTIHEGANVLVEIKDGSKPKSRQALTPDEEIWQTNWCGQVGIARTMEEALALVGMEALI